MARVSGFPEIPRFSFVHALNIRACGRRLAAELGATPISRSRPSLPDDDGQCRYRLGAVTLTKRGE